MSEEKIATPEEKQAIEVENDRQRAVAFRFLAQNIRLKQNNANASKLHAYIVENGLEWTVDNLQYAADRVEGLEYKTDQEASTPTPVAIPEVKPEFPWPKLTPQVIRDMDRQSYRKFVKDPRFVKQVEALGFRR
jgi:hypothetical protein